MASASAKSLPPMVPFPEAAWRTHIVPEEWAACLDAWVLLVEAHLSLSALEFQRISATDKSIPTFLFSYVSEAALASDTTSLGVSLRWRKLWKQCFILSNRLFHVEQPPENILKWEFLSDFCKMYGKARSAKVIASLWTGSQHILEKNFTALKTSLIEKLELGVKGNQKDLEQKLKRLNHLLHSSPETATFFMIGSGFLDGLVSCYELMKPPLRKVIISTTYLSLLGLTAESNPKFSLLTDQLYSLKAAADSNKAGPTNASEQLVAELVTVTPIIKQIQRRVDGNETSLGRARSILSSLEGFRKAGEERSNKVVQTNISKGKGRAPPYDEYSQSSSDEINIHRMSLITQVQDLFPDLGSRFVTKLLDEYEGHAEKVVAHLLEGSLPAYLENTRREEVLSQGGQVLAPRSTPPLLPTRRNFFDNDEFDQLAVNTSHLYFGRRNPDKTADDLLKDRSSAPNKAAILSALAVFDSDDDERDDTYDLEDVGGTVDSATPGNNLEEVNTDTSYVNEEALFKAFKMTPGLFNQDAATRRSKPRIALKEETGITDEAIEGWAIMLSRDPRRMRRLVAKFSSFSDAQRELPPSAWRSGVGGSGAEDSDGVGKGGGAGGGGESKGTRGRGRGGRRRGGNVAEPTGGKETELARQRKEANKGSRANHNRRDQRAKKMARSGFPG